MTERAIQTPEERYLRDYPFNRLVDTAVWAMTYHCFTSSDLTDAFNLAARKSGRASVDTQGEQPE